MKAFYEQNRSGTDGFSCEIRKSFPFPSHFHQNIEIFINIKGNYNITIEKNEYSVKDYSVVFIDSFCVHSYSVGISEDQCVIIIPYSMLTEFNKARCGKTLSSPIINDAELSRKILDIAKEHLMGNVDEYEKFSAVNMILCLILKCGDFSNVSRPKEDELIRKILGYIEENYRDDVSLKSVAKHFGYAEEHVSRVFHSYVNVSFPNYVNTRRLEFVKQMMEIGEKNLTDVIFDAGFKSLQTYYRFKKQSEDMNIHI